MGKSNRRAVAEALRLQQEAEAKRRKIVFGVAIGAAVALIGGLLAVGIWMNRSPEYEVTDPAAQTDDYALELGSGDVEIDIYIDYMCPACKMFEEAYAEDIESWLADGSVTVRYHTIAILNRFSQGTEYSTRAASAAVCAADEGEQQFLDYSTALFANQPSENTTGLDDAELVRIGAEEVGLGDGWEQCVTDGTYKGWVQQGTSAATGDQGVTGTPTVKINGQKLENNALFGQEVEAAISA
jgi:protein-disulfide isomerase